MPTATGAKPLTRIEVDRTGDPDAPTDRSYQYVLYVNGRCIGQLYVERHDKTPLLIRPMRFNTPGSKLVVKMLSRQEAAELLRAWRKVT